MSLLSQLTPAAAPCLAAALALATGLTACGSATTGSATTGTDTSPRSRPDPRHFGAELTGPEAHRAAAPLHGYLEARAAERWTEACSYLAKPIRRIVDRFAARSKGFPGSDCPSFVAYSTKKHPPAELSALGQLTVGSVRAEGDHGYVLYRADGDHAIPISAEGATWKLAALNGTSLTP